MRALRCTESLVAEIQSSPDRLVASLLSMHMDFVRQYEDYEVEDLFHAFIVEPGDSLETIDEAMDGQFLTNHYSGKQHGQPGFKPCCETLEEYPTFYEMFFIQSDEGFGVAVLVPKRPDIDPQILALCAQFATPASSLPS
jgi:hypothetical protein